MSKRVLIKEAAKLTGVSEYTLRTWAKANSVPHFKVGNRYIFDLELLEDHLKKLAAEGLKEEAESGQYGQIRKID